MMNNQKLNITKQHGFTLLESMVALLIFSVGLLGLAGMQSAAIRNNKGALDRTVATQLAYDMAEQIRSNRGGFIRGEFDNLQDATAPAGGAGAPMFAQQFRDWELVVRNELPGGVARVAVAVPAGNGVNVTVFWDADRTGANGFGCNPAVVTDLRCMTLTVRP